MAMFLWNWIRCTLRTSGSSIFQYECPARVVGIGQGQGQGGQPRGLAQRQQRARHHLDGGVAPHYKLVIGGKRSHLAHRGQHQAGLVNARARRPQGVEAEQNIGGSGKDTGGRAQ